MGAKRVEKLAKREKRKAKDKAKIHALENAGDGITLLNMMPPAFQHKIINEPGPHFAETKNMITIYLGHHIFHSKGKDAMANMPDDDVFDLILDELDKVQAETYKKGKKIAYCTPDKRSYDLLNEFLTALDKFEIIRAD